MKWSERLSICVERHKSFSDQVRNMKLKRNKMDKKDARIKQKKWNE